MVYELLIKLLRKHLYLIFHERYRNENANLVVERFGAKHPLLKPEFIILNDQVHGFKKQDHRYSGLEKFPIFVEMEYSEDEDEKLIEGIDIHAEVNIKLRDHLGEVVKLAKTFEKSVIVERTRLLTDATEESLVVYSKISELYSSSYVEDDLEEGVIEEPELTQMIEQYLIGYTTFLQALDDLLSKRKRKTMIDGIYSANDGD
jgi:hypothetical protein